MELEVLLTQDVALINSTVAYGENMLMREKKKKKKKKKKKGVRYKNRLRKIRV